MRHTLHLGASIVLGLIPVISMAQEATVGVGAEAHEPYPYQEALDYHAPRLINQPPLESRRFGEGTPGDAWISVAPGPYQEGAWNRVVLKCKGVRWTQPFPDQGYRHFTALPEGERCTLKFAGGAPKRTYELHTPQVGEAESWVLLTRS